MLTARSLVAIIIRLGKTNHAGQNTIKTINFTILLTNNKTLIQFCSSLENGVYNLKDSSEIYKVYCQMTEIPGLIVLVMFGNLPKFGKISKHHEYY